MKLKSTVTTACSLAVLLGATNVYAQGMDDNKVVRDSRGNIVRSYEHGTCTRTKWEEGKDECAVAPRVVAQPAPQPVERTVLSKEDATVYFAFDSAQLAPDAKEKLDDVATTLQGAKDIQSADIVGYADIMGNKSYNEALSRKRAQAVKAYLAERGYLNTQVAAVRGVGATNSVTQCDLKMPRDEKIACLSADRRVEVEVKYITTETTY